MSTKLRQKSQKASNSRQELKRAWLILSNAQENNPASWSWSGTEFSGTTFVPSYRTGDFLDPKSRAKDTGVDYAQGLVALGGDDEELARENVKRDLTGNGVITLSVDSVDENTNEFSGTFVAIQPSDNDLGSKDPTDIKIVGNLYGRKG